ncbi:MAG: cupin domain-containing protein [Planctomycetota bacterium]
MEQVIDSMLEGVPLRGAVAGTSTFTSRWEIQVDAGPAKFYLVLQGRCWLTLDDQRPPVALADGDLAVVAPRLAHRLADDVHSPTVPVEELATHSSVQEPQAIAPAADGPRTTIVRGSFVLDGRGDHPLFAALPPMIHVRGEAGGTASGWDDLLRLIVRESETAQPGSQSVVNRLVQVVFINAVRAYAATMPQTQGDWLGALMDPAIGPALRLMHERPEALWTVASLAKEVNMSRSAFAAKFAALVGQPPLRYLLRCRMEKACSLLR